MVETTINLSKREIWLIEWIAKRRHDLWDLTTEEIMIIVMREWIKAQFDQYQELHNEVKQLQNAKNSL